MTKWSELTPDETQIDSTTEAIDLQNGNSNQRIKFSTPTLGLSVIPVHKLSDLPSVVNGFHQLEQDKIYQFVEPITSPDVLLVPAGWRGYLTGMHNSLTGFTYNGPVKPAFRTLNIDGVISSIADAGGGAITVTTSADHGLLNGQFVNITGTTFYNQQRLLISNASGSVFDVQIIFAGDESGSFDTGYNSLNLMNIDISSITGPLLDVTAATSLSVFRFNNIKMSSFGNFGEITNGIVIGYDGNFDFIGDGLGLEFVSKVTISSSTFTNTNPASSSALLFIMGSGTVDHRYDRIIFNLSSPNQSPIEIGSSTIPGLISITNSPDDGVANSYFRPGDGGLDKTAQTVFAFNNGLRPNSITESESRSVGILEVDGSAGSGVPVPIEDITPAPGDFELDIASEGFSIDDSTGVVTYEGLAIRTIQIGYSLEAAQTSGASQNLTFDLRINNIQQTKTIRTLITMGVGSFEPVVNIGGFFIINPGDTFKLFKTNTTNSNNTDVQNTILLIR